MDELPAISLCTIGIEGQRHTGRSACGDLDESLSVVALRDHILAVDSDDLFVYTWDEGHISELSELTRIEAMSLPVFAIERDLFPRKSDQPPQLFKLERLYLCDRLPSDTTQSTEVLPRTC